MPRLLRRFRIGRRRYGRRLGSQLLLVAFALTAAGVPLPMGSSPKKSSEPFPCATCKCGCASAEQCWRSCCCHTLAQRLAWAREHGVEPPAFAVAEAHRMSVDLGDLAEGRGRERPGSQKAAACCTKKVAADTPSCCQKKPQVVASTKPSCCQKHVEQPAVESSSDKADQSVVAWRALACHGHSIHWLAAVPTLVAVRLEWSQQLPCVAWLGPAASEHGEGISDNPTVPPPERA
jgi:hypothetical protein